MTKLVVANRGEIARRILRTARAFGYRVGVISTVEERDALVRAEADEVLEVDDFLDAEAIVAASRKWGADMLHPGYGFLSESASFAELVESGGIAFVGPKPQTMKLLGNKEKAKELAVRCGVPDPRRPGLGGAEGSGRVSSRGRDPGERARAAVARQSGRRRWRTGYAYRRGRIEASRCAGPGFGRGGRRFCRSGGLCGALPRETASRGDSGVRRR